jgi:hypothetical protein
MIHNELVLLVGTNISTMPITILTTILYTSKKNFFLKHNTGIQYWNKFLYQYCDRQVQEILYVHCIYKIKSS